MLCIALASLDDIRLHTPIVLGVAGAFVWTFVLVWIGVADEMDFIGCCCRGSLVV